MVVNTYFGSYFFLLLVLLIKGGKIGISAWGLPIINVSGKIVPQKKFCLIFTFLEIIVWAKCKNTSVTNIQKVIKFAISSFLPKKVNVKVILITINAVFHFF